MMRQFYSTGSWPKIGTHLGHALAAVSIIVPVSAVAQTASAQPQSAQPDQANPSQLADIVVTAQKRSENLQNVPIAITALTDRILEKTNASTLSNIEALVPGVTFGRDGRASFGQIGIRGVSDYARTIGNDSRVGVYIDGVLQGRSYAGDADLLGVERVEVLRGPQGTLFGRGTDAGAISITTMPAASTFGVKVQADVGNFDYRKILGRIDAPMSDQLLFSASIASRYQSGYLDNLTNGKKLNGQDSVSARAQLCILATDRLEIALAGDYFRESVALTGAQALAGPGYTLAPDPYQVAQDADGNTVRRFWGGSATISYRLPGDLTVTSISAYRNALIRVVSDEDYTPAFVAVSMPDENSRQFTQELRLTSRTNGSFKWVAGLYYFDQTIETNRRVITGPAFALGPGSVDAPGRVGERSIAGYVHADYELAPELQLSGGLRFSRERKTFLYSITDTTGLFANFQNYRDSMSHSDASPSASLSYKPVAGVMLYASYSRGFKSGGWNADYIRTLQGIAFGPETANAYELGTKTELFDRSLRVNVALFLTNYNNFQIQQYTPLPSGGTLLTYTNGGAARSRGIEAEVTWRPVSGLTIGANGAYTDAFFTSFPNGGGIGIDYTGKHLPFAPEWKSYLYLDYGLDVGSAGRLELYGGFGQESKSYSNPANTADYLAGPSTNLTGRISFRPKALPIKFSLWGDNILNRVTLKARDVSFLGVKRGVIAPPRTFGLSLSTEF